MSAEFFIPPGVTLREDNGLIEEWPAPDLVPGWRISVLHSIILCKHEVPMNFYPLTKKRPPLETPCVLAWRDSVYEGRAGRVVAYAQQRRARVRWYGVTAPWHDAVELKAQFLGFVPVRDVLNLAREWSGFPAWQPEGPQLPRRNMWGKIVDA